MRPAGEQNRFQLNVPVRVTGSVVIGAAKRRVFLELRKRVEGKQCVDRRVTISCSEAGVLR
jgi:hypothetical protein